MRLINPDSKPSKKKGYEEAENILDFDGDSAEKFVDMLLQFEENTGYFPPTREQALGAATVQIHQGESYWANLTAFLQTITDEEYDTIIKQLYEWHNWE